MSKIIKTTFSLMVVMMISKILGFGRELVLASSYGASMYSDAYITAMNIPNVIFAIIGGCIGTALIPIYMEVYKKLGKDKSLIFMNNIINIVVIVCIIFSVLGIVFTDKIVKLFAIGFKGEQLSVAINFTRITMLGIVFTGLSYVMTAYLQTKDNFIVPGFISVPKNIIIIASIILSIKYGPYLMIIGTLIGISMEFLFQVPFAIKAGYKYKLYIDIKDEYIKRMMYLIIPVLIGISVNQVNMLVDRTLASTLAEGSISALNYANKLNNFVIGLFISSVSAVIYPMLSKYSSEDNIEKFRYSVNKSISSVILLIIPISIGAIVLSVPIIRILFERGEFDSSATYITSIALVMYSIGMASFGINDLLGRVFYSIQDTKTPMINSAISMIINIILNFISIKYLKIAGLALSTSISSIICMILLMISLNKKIGYFGQDKIIKTTYKSIFASGIMGVITYFSYNILYNLQGDGYISEITSLCGSIIIGFLIYVVIIILLRVEEIDLILDKFNIKGIKIPN